jgi:pimeloyl-ACP methyl ester carboxylesterase
MWHQLAESLPKSARVVAVDLLGFGKSPDPGWAKYDATTQAKSILKTLLIHRIPLRSLFVGHSLGALVAVETARRYPWYVSRLVLISPPIYKPSRRRIVATQKEDILRGIYKILYRNPRNTERALLLARKYYVKRTGTKVAAGMNIDTFLAALEASVINQSTIDHIADVKAPITIMSGSRDPLVVTKNLTRIAKTSDDVRHVVIKKAGHNVVGIMKEAVSKELNRLLGPS